MNSLEIKFLMRGPYNELNYVEAQMDPDIGRNLIVRTCDPKTFEMSGVIDSEIFGEYYRLALIELNRMCNFTFLPSHNPKEFIKVRIER